jgi:hypoxanthine phosphoribosyltransferase
VSSSHNAPDVLISADALAARVAELGRRISTDYAGKGEVLLIGVLRGAFIFLADLSRHLTVPCRVEFIALSRYEHGATAGAVRLVMDVRTDVAGRHVLVVEDIIDSGHTLAYLSAMLRARGAASVRTCVLTRKPGRLTADVSVDYVGFDIPERWVVGYGLDYDGRWRTLPYIGVVEPPVTPPASARSRTSGPRPWSSGA